MKLPLRPQRRRAVVRAEIERRQLIGMSRALCTRHYHMSPFATQGFPL